MGGLRTEISSTAAAVSVARVEITLVTSDSESIPTNELSNAYSPDDQSDHFLRSPVIVHSIVQRKASCHEKTFQR